MASDQSRVTVGSAGVDVFVIKGDLATDESDVIVCTTSKNLALARGRASKALLDVAGRGMQTECESNYPDGIQYNKIAVVRGGHLRCKDVFFLALPVWGTGHDEIKVLQTVIMRCLKEANKRNYRSIAFPALGTGMLKYPNEMVAKTTFQCVEDFSNDHPQSSLQLVNIIIFHKDAVSLHAFETKAKDYAKKHDQGRSSKYGGAKPKIMKNIGVRSIICRQISNGHEDSSSFGNMEVNVEIGNYSKTLADVIVNNVQPGTNFIDGDLSWSLSKKAGPMLEEEYAGRFPHGVRSGDIAVTKGYKLKCTYVYHGSLQRLDKDKTASAKKNLCKIVCNCLKQAEKDEVKCIAFPPLGTGECNFPVDVCASTMFKCFKKHQQNYSGEFPSEILIVIDKETENWEGIKEIFDTELRIALHEDEDELVDDSNDAMYKLLEMAAKNSLERTMLPPRGTNDWYKHFYRTNPRSPSYWTKYNDVKTLKDWLLESDDIKPHKIPVDRETFEAIRKVVADTWKQKHVGQGRDAHGLDSLKYTNIRVVRIERIENCELFEKYALKRQELFQKAAKHGEFPRLHNIPGSSGKILTTDCVPKDSALNKDIHDEINEHYMFHGTLRDVADTIVKQGLDCRLGGAGAMFGQGVYAAESSTKSDQYADPKSNRTNSEKQMFLIRMCLGRMCIEKNAKSLARAPCMKCQHDKCSCHDNDFYDSVVADGGWNFREFIVYDRTQVYPEYLITYVRV